jgi:hypothetical protein
VFQRPTLLHPNVSIQLMNFAGPRASTRVIARDNIGGPQAKLDQLPWIVKIAEECIFGKPVTPERAPAFRQTGTFRQHGGCPFGKPAESLGNCARG